MLPDVMHLFDWIVSSGDYWANSIRELLLSLLYSGSALPLCNVYKHKRQRVHVCQMFVGLLRTGRGLFTRHALGHNHRFFCVA